MVLTLSQLLFTVLGTLLNNLVFNCIKDLPSEYSLYPVVPVRPWKEPLEPPQCSACKHLKVYCWLWYSITFASSASVWHLVLASSTSISSASASAMFRLMLAIITLISYCFFSNPVMFHVSSDTAKISFTTLLFQACKPSMCQQVQPQYPPVSCLPASIVFSC